jgi:hypothetical protein
LVDAALASGLARDEGTDGGEAGEVLEGVCISYFVSKLMHELLPGATERKIFGGWLRTGAAISVCKSACLRATGEGLGAGYIVNSLVKPNTLPIYTHSEEFG